MVYVTLKYGPFADDAEARTFIQDMERANQEHGLLMDAYVVNQHGAPTSIPDIREDNNE
jgi:hypothetical protein